MAISPAVLKSYLLSDLSDQGLPLEGDPWPDITLRQSFALSISESLLKKWEVENSSDADKAALEKFLQVNVACKEWALPDLATLSETDGWRSEMLLNGVKDVVWSFWNRHGYPLVDHPFDLLAKGKVGPGANALADGGDFYTKFFSSRLSCSDRSLYSWYRRYITAYPEWLSAEETRQSSYGDAVVVEGSRLAFVPKNDKISRCICVEPTLNTYFQLGLGWHLERRLSERFGIALEDQQFKNRDLACLGSITDGLSTIDLSSASDSISLGMLRWLLPPDFYNLLMKYRCSQVEIPGHGSVQLNMISTMGNGYTFPLQTMIFAAAVVACFHLRGIPVGKSASLRKWGSGSTSENLWGVNGDDIVVPRSITQDVIFLLKLLGFSVNNDKTFVEGPFRESCGGDYFRGTNVRGVYIKRLKTDADLYSAYNRLVRFQTRSGIDLPKTLAFLFRNMKRVLLVPRWSNIDSGIHSPLSVARPYLRRDPDTQSYEYMELQPAAKKVRFTDSGKVVVPRRHKPRLYNPSGLLTSILQGSVKSGTVGVRDNDAIRYVAKRRLTSSWDGCELRGLTAAKVVASPRLYALAGALLDPLIISDVQTKRHSYDYGLDWGRWESGCAAALERGGRVTEV